MNVAPADVGLRADERLIRSDMVWFYLTSTGGLYPNPPTRRGFGSMSLARMAITSERVILLPPDGVPAWYRLAPIITIVSLSLVRRFTPLPARDDIELAHVTRLWKWEPEFSGPPMIQSGDESWTFALLIDRRPWNMPAPKDAVRDHFAAVESAWEAARERAASHEDHP